MICYYSVMGKLNNISKGLYGMVAALTLLFAVFVYQQSEEFTPIYHETAYDYEFVRGKVVEINHSSSETGIELLVKIRGGKMVDEVVVSQVSAVHNFNKYKIGDDVQVYAMTNTSTDKVTYEVADYYHQNGLFWIFIFFSVVAVIVARKKGMTAVLSVGLSLALFYFVFLKMVVAGYSPVLACLVFVLIVTVLTIPLIHGFNKKAFSAMTAIFIGYGLSFLAAYLFENISQLGIAPGEEFRILGIMYPDVSLSDVLIATLFMGAVGALIDTAVSISSAIFEAVETHSRQTFEKIYKIGMEIGKDVLGSMINTLLFAYLASALPFLILISLDQGSGLSELINMDFIALELTRTFVGAISLVLLIPIAASISAYVFVKCGKQ